MMRDFVEPRPNLADSSILVTGGTGSFGKSFVRHVLDRYKPRKVIVFSRDEQKQFDMADELPLAAYPSVRYFIGDVRDVDRLELAMRGVDIVVHAAAMKHVPIAEYNPFECVRTNIHGAENVVKAAIRTGVKKVVALSTDKASNPVNLYGATKLASDKIFVAANNLSGVDGPVFSIVRYGNVVGSRGSVLPYFRRLIARGIDHLPITHPEMTRFWITVDQGVAFVLSSIALMRGGEIFVPKIPSMRVVDLARLVAPDLPQRIIGIRPGERLHESMIAEDDARTTFELDDRYAILSHVPDAPNAVFGHHAAKLVDPAFRYSSQLNSEWLDDGGMQRLMSATPHV